MIVASFGTSSCIYRVEAARLWRRNRCLVLDVGWQILSLTLSRLSRPPPLPAVQRPRHRLGELPPLFPLLDLDDILTAFAVPALLELLPELLVEGQGLVGLLLCLALVVVVLVIGVDKVGLIVVRIVNKTGRLEGDGALVAGLVPGFGARVGNTSCNAHDEEEGHGQEDQHDDAEGDEIFVHGVFGW
jgi:hypothetical protein